MLSFHAPGKPNLEAPDESIPDGAIWIDALNPTEHEITILERALNIAVPTRESLSAIESSSRLRSEKNWLYLSLPMIYRSGGFLPVLTSLGFALSKDILVTVRFNHLRAFDSAAESISRLKVAPGGPMALAIILESIVEHAADTLEGLGGDLDCLSQEIFGPQGAEGGSRRPRTDSRRLRRVMREIGRCGDLASKLEDSLLGLARLLPFVEANAAAYLDKSLSAKFESLHRDVASLNDYETHLTDKIQFLLDATLGLTNVEQNNIFRILTIVSVVGIPPTFFASMWGMNFKNIPEYNWSYGYQFGLAVIVVSAVIPILWFKWRGWW